MITHRPAGSGHPYVPSPDQRVPVQPVAGVPVRLGIVCLPDAEPVCELVRGARPAELIPARLADTPEPGAAGGGHLASAQADAVSAAGVAWQVVVDHLQAGVPHRYRFTAGGTSTDWFEFVPARWVAQADFPGGVIEIDARGTVAARPSGVEWLTNGETHRVRFQLPLGAAEHVVGFGERFDALDQVGLTPDSVVFEQYKNQGETHRTYFPMPFAHVVGGEGWGFHIRTSRRVWFDVGATDPGRLIVEAEVGPDAHLAVDLYGGDPVTVLAGFLDDVGRAEVLPDWVHRLWASGNEWNTQAIVTARMDEHASFGVPVGVVVIEAWSDEEGITIFRDARYDVHEDGRPFAGPEFSYPVDGAWPDPAGMIAEMHRRGIKVVLWQIPLLKSAATFARENQSHGQQVIRDGEALVASGFSIRDEDGTPYHNRAWWFPQALMPDLSTPEGRDWWTQRRRYLVRDLDVDGFKTDGGEHAWGDLGYRDGTRGVEGNNLNPVRYAQAFGDLLRSCGKAPLTFSRSGFTGSQAHGVFWAGDESSTWAAFRNSIVAGLTAGACGVVYWGWDIAGFSGPVPTPELYVRAAAASVFMPIMQYHSEFNHHQPPLRDRTPWNIADQTGDNRVIDDFRSLVELRERLVPYIARQAAQTVKTDNPLMRALFFEWPDDPMVWQFPLEYMFGDALLVHPVTEEAATTWPVYLPEGSWVDVWTGVRHGGGQVVQCDVADRTRLPVFCLAAAWPQLAPVFQV